MDMKKGLIIAICSIAVVFTMIASSAVYAAQTSTVEKVGASDELTNITAKDTATSRELNKNPEAKLEGNKDIALSEVCDINKVIDFEKIKKEKGVLKEKKLMTYGEYLNTSSLDKLELTAISEDRQLWVVKTEYADGYEHPKLGYLEDVTMTELYDSETGEYLGNEIKANHYKSERP